MTRSWTLTAPGRPITFNVYRSLPWQAWSKHNREVRETWGWLAKAARVPELDAITVEVRPMIAKGRMADCGACAPDVKAAVDGLVDSRVVPDDDGRYVRSITFYPPVKGTEDALVLVITEVLEEAEEVA